MILLMTVCMMRESEAVALLATDVTLDMIGGSWSLVHGESSEVQD